mgnify:CR=1 FL=1
MHGIDFIDYAATNAFLAQGKDIQELLPTLGVELPQWEEAAAHWENQMANDPEYKLAMQLGEVFQSPAQGKYAGAATQTADDAVAKIPTVEDFIDLQQMMSTAASFGVDPQAAMLERGITLMDYSQASMRFMDRINAELSADPTGAFNHYIGDLRTAAEKKYTAIFKELAGGAIGDDIEF